MSTVRTQSVRKSPARPPTKSSWKGLLWRLIVVFLVVIIGLVIYLDARVTLQFEGKRWALPAKVYARPLEIYPGARLTQQALSQELGLLGYRRQPGATQPGTFQSDSGKLLVYRRGFDLWNEPLAAGRYQVFISQGRVTAVQDDRGADVDIVTLDPLQIGGIYPAHNEDRVLLKLEKVPGFLLETLISVEDQSFYSHAGVSPRGIARALWANLQARQVVQGGSTLTQQLIKNFHLSSERTLLRKLTEAAMALLLEFHYSKAEILEAYLNEVYLGQSGVRAIHGFGLASQHYFGRNITQLKLHQAALLVSLVKGPSYYNPRRHPARAMKRRNLVLDLLVKQGKISADKVDWAKRQPLDVITKSHYAQSEYPAFMDLVRRQLRRDYQADDLSSKGLRIFTSLDPLVQQSAEQSLKQSVADFKTYYGSSMGPLEGAVVVTSTDSGEVLAVVGGGDPRYSGFNRALDAVRSVGSLLKPAVYLAALSEPDRYQLSTPVDDGQVNIKLADGKVWQPQNADHKDHGSVPLHRALAKSYNQATARLGMDVGLSKVIDTLQNLGIERKLSHYPSIMLGAGGLSPIEVASMYQTISAAGFHTPLRAITSITGSDGTPLSRYPLRIEQRFDAGVMHLLNYALQETMREGTGRIVYQTLSPELNVAGKTGTTDDLRDSWFAGFSGDRLSVVWLGRDDNKPIGLSGSRGALKVWSKLMQQINPVTLKGPLPANIEYHWIDDKTSLLTQSHCQNARFMPFIVGSAPKQTGRCKLSGDRLGDWVKSWFQ